MQCTIIKHTPFIDLRPHHELEQKMFDGAKGYLIFRHNNHNGSVLFSENKQEFLKSNTPDKFSELNQLDDFKNNAGEYEFMLEYDSGPGQYNRGKQTSNFTKDKIAGYKAIHIDGNKRWGGGLMPATQTTTGATGSTQDYGFYAIGAREAYNGGIPNGDGVETANVRLGVRDEKKEK